MKKKITLAALLIIFSWNGFSQITFQKTYGGTGYAGPGTVRQTADGGYVIIGGTNSFGAGMQDAYLLKTDANGNLIWSKTFGGTGSESCGSGQQTTDGGYVMAGTTNSSGAGNEDVYLVKTDAGGNLLWSKTYGGTNTDRAYSLEQTSDGGYVIGGHTFSFGAGSVDVYLLKTDAAGNLLWSKTYGQTGIDECFLIRQTTDGGYVMVGHTNSFGAGTDDVYFLKTDSGGNLLWTKVFDGGSFDIGLSVQQTTDGGYIIVGTTTSFGAGGNDIWLLKTNSAGNLLWTKTIGGVNDDFGYSVHQTSDGGYVISGYTDIFATSAYDFYVIKMDGSANILWTKTYGGFQNDQSVFVQQTADGGYVITGATSSFGPGFQDVYLIKTDSAGNSGCNEGNIPDVAAWAVASTISPVSLVSSGGVAGNPVTVTGSGCIITDPCMSTNIQSTILNAQSAITISPNPVTSEITLDFGKDESNALWLCNTLGEVLFETTISAEQMKIDVRDFPSGIYFVAVRDAKNNLVVRKIVKM